MNRALMISTLMNLARVRSMKLSNQQLQIVTKVVAPDRLSEEIFGTIQPILGSIRSRNGCIGCHLYRDSEDPNEMILFEEWKNEAAFTEHVRSSDYRHILEWMELSTMKPEVTVSNRLNDDGLQLIRKIKTDHLDSGN